ncbi:MAG: hypothetical protein HUU47_04685 [Bacteroidetes bacterium]|nr:hypothetical protein [Bacteroidota bacterium]
MKNKLLLILSFMPALLMAQKNVTKVNPEADLPQKYERSFIRTEFNDDPFLRGNSNKTQLNKKHPNYSAILMGIHIMICKLMHQ